MPESGPNDVSASSSESEEQAQYEERLLLEESTDEQINQAVLNPMFETGPKFWILVAILVAIVCWGIFAWIYQIYWGMGTAGINDPVYWGMYIATFVFWVGISHAGTMISAVLRLMNDR